MHSFQSQSSTRELERRGCDLLARLSLANNDDYKAEIRAALIVSQLFIPKHNFDIYSRESQLGLQTMTRIFAVRLDISQIHHKHHICSCRIHQELAVAEPRTARRPASLASPCNIRHK